MKRNNEMRIAFLLDIIILTALLVTSASASLENTAIFHLHPLPSLIDHFHNDLSADAGKDATNCNCSGEKTVITPAGLRSSEIVRRVSPTSGIGIDLDEKGVPSYRNPVTISQTAMSYYQQYQEGNKSARGFFLNCSDWLVENAAKRDNYSVWLYSNIRSCMWGAEKR